MGEVIHISHALRANEIVPQRGYCIGCRARISAMRIVRGPYRSEP